MVGADSSMSAGAEPQEILTAPATVVGVPLTGGEIAVPYGLPVDHQPAADDVRSDGPQGFAMAAHDGFRSCTLANWQYCYPPAPSAMEEYYAAYDASVSSQVPIACRPHAASACEMQPAVEDAPVYVNAKQYHCILRRRAQRAKAEAENRMLRVRQPYLHKSRHEHAARRVRGAGGRFLKKPGQVADAGRADDLRAESFGAGDPGCETHSQAAPDGEPARLVAGSASQRDMNSPSTALDPRTSGAAHSSQMQSAPQAVPA